MNSNIILASILGFLTYSTIWVYRTHELTKTQKIFLYVCVLFAPLQWVSIVIFLAFNKNQIKRTPQYLEKKQFEKEIDLYKINLGSLKALKNQNIISPEEFQNKINKLENSKLDSEVRKSENYNKLLSLFKNNLLTKEELEEKIEILKKNLILNRNKNTSVNGIPRIIETNEHHIVFDDGNEINVYKNLDGSFFIMTDNGREYFKNKMDAIVSAYKNIK